MDLSTTERLERVEDECRRLTKTNRRWRGVATVLLILSAIPWVVGARRGVTRQIEAERFTLIGPAGEERASLSVSSDGEPILVLFDHRGQSRVRMFVNRDDEAILDFTSKSEKPRVRLGVLKDEESGLAVFDEQRENRIVMNVVGGEPGLGLWDKEKRGIRASVSRGAPRVEVLGKGESARIELGLSQGGDSGLTIRNTAGKETYRAPMQ